MATDSSGERNKEKSTDRRKWIPFLIWGGAALTVAAPIVFTWTYGVQIDSKGEIGSVLGGITAPVVGLLGAILVYYALKEQIAANKLINDQFEQQKIVSIRQNFEQTFFNMLSNHHRIVEQLQINQMDIVNALIDEHDRAGRFFLRSRFGSSDVETDNNRNVFVGTYDVLIALLEYHDNEKITSEEGYQITEVSFNDHTIRTSFNDIYETMFDLLNSDFGHYYRNLYRIVKMIYLFPTHLGDLVAVLV